MSMTDEVSVRREKLNRLRDEGINPYPASCERTHHVQDVLLQFDGLVADQAVLSIVGRLLTIRVHGGMIFADLFDGSGKIQIAFKEDVLQAEEFIRFRDMMDPGDFVEVKGVLFLTKRGERTLRVQSWRPLAKALMPLPEKWHGLTDTEARFRKRYLDLLMNASVRDRLLTRSRIISSIRTLLDARGFIEVETPTLQPLYGGGFARPFVTHHNALDVDFYLRISDEMYLKRLLVGGFERVYEITKVFRNEGIDHDHNPEFTMFEAQVAYQDYRWGMDIFEEIFEHAATSVLGTTEVRHGDVSINVQRPWKRYRLVDAVREIGGLDVSLWQDIGEAKECLAPHLGSDHKRLELGRMRSVGEVIAFAFEELVEEKLIQPTIIYDYPIEVSPLAKKTADPRYTGRFEAFALGSEIGNNYSELNDPVDLACRFVEENKKEQAGFDEAHQTDQDYLEAISHGMPPACGLGIGIDRMTMLLTGSGHIKEVILFPTLRPRQDGMSDDTR